MARLCEDGAAAQSDLVIGEQVFTSGIDSLKIGVAVVASDGTTVSDNVVRGDVGVYETNATAPISDNISQSNGKTPGDSVAPTDSVIITNT